jgi:hypothetical protein
MYIPGKRIVFSLVRASQQAELFAFTYIFSLFIRENQGKNPIFFNIFSPAKRQQNLCL